MVCSKHYISPALLALSLLLLLTPGQHYELYIPRHDNTLLHQLINQAANLLGIVLAWVSVLALHRYIPAAITSLLCCYVYTALTNVFLPSAYWATVIITVARNYFITLLLTTFTNRVAISAEELSKSTNTKNKWTLQTFFALFYGITSASYIFSSFFNLYLTSDRLTFANILSRRLLENSTKDDESCSNGEETCYNLNTPLQFHNGSTIILSHSTELYPPQTMVTISVAYVLLGVTSGFLASTFWYALTKCGLPRTGPNIKSMFLMLTDLKFSFLIPCMIYSGVIEGYIFTDFIVLNIRCYGYGDHKELAVMCYGGACMVVCGALVILNNRVNMVLRVTATSLFQISIIILLIMYPGRVNHVAMFYVIMALLATCLILWHTQIAVLIADFEPKRKLQGYANFYLFHGLGYIISFIASLYLCMNTRLYFLLGSVILSQFLYLVNEVEIRIYKISLQRGKPGNSVKQTVYPKATIPNRAQSDGTETSYESKPMLPNNDEDLTEENKCNGNRTAVRFEQ